MYGPAYCAFGQAPPPKISSVPVPWIEGGQVSPSTKTMSSPSPHQPPWSCPSPGRSRPGFPGRLPPARRSSPRRQVLPGPVPRRLHGGPGRRSRRHWAWRRPTFGASPAALVVQVVPAVRDRQIALILELDSSPRGERHRQEAVETVGHVGAVAARIDCQHQRGEIGELTVGGAEEVAERDLDRWGRLAIPVGSDDDLAQVQLVRTADGGVEAVDAAGTLDVCQDGRLARLDADPIVIAAGPVMAGDPARPARPKDRQLTEQARWQS